MKFAHISDTHLGFSQFGTGERAKDVYNAFLQAIDISIKEKVEFVVFAGDIFHTPTPDGTAIINMAHALKKLQDVQIPAYFILGEHDISHAMLHPVPFVYHKLGYAVHVGEKPAYHKDIMIAIKGTISIEHHLLSGQVDENRMRVYRQGLMILLQSTICKGIYNVKPFFALLILCSSSMEFLQESQNSIRSLMNLTHCIIVKVFLASCADL